MAVVQKILVLGGTGGTGREVVSQALAAGHEVTALVRDPSGCTPHPRLRVVQGDATDATDVAEIVPGHDAVVVTLGAPTRSLERVRERAMAALVAAMRASGVRRLVVQSSYGVAETRAELPWMVRYLFVPLFLGRVFRDHEAQEDLIRESGLAWTVVRPPFLTDGPQTSRWRTGRRGGPPGSELGTRISRADVAAFLLFQLGSDEWIGQAVAVSS